MVDNNMNDSNSVAGMCRDTIHLASEHLDDHIYISEKPVNDFNYQIVFKCGLPADSISEVIFKQKCGHKIFELAFNESRIRRHFSKIQDSYKKLFANSKIYVLRCTDFLTDLPIRRKKPRISNRELSYK